MAARSISETQRVRYLLGLSSPAEREHVEREYLEDDDAFQEMLAAEDDLFDAYACGELTGAERRTFEQRFISSFQEGARVRFARALASTVSANQSAKTKVLDKLVYIFKTPQALGLLRGATVAAVIVFVAVFVWLVIDRKIMTNELRELRAESAELSKRTEALLRSSETDRTRTAEIAAQLADLRAQPDKPKHREGTTTATQRATIAGVTVAPFNTYSLIPRKASSGVSSTVRGTVKDPNGKVVTGAIVTLTDSAAEAAIKTSDATLGNSFENKLITELPLNANNVVGLLSLQPGVSRGGYVSGGRADQSNITLDGVDAGVRTPGFPNWIRFQLALETALIHDHYRITIKTADGRPVTFVDWIEPVTTNQTIIDTPAIASEDLPPGNYVLELLGKEPNGSFTKLAEYSFKVIRY